MSRKNKQTRDERMAKIYHVVPNQEEVLEARRAKRERFFPKFKDRPKPKGK